MREFTLRMIDSEELHCYEWNNVEKPTAVLQLVHGSCEHLGRYNEFAKAINKAGIIVVGDDHRGHGKTAFQENKLGYFSNKHGWEKLIDDQKIVNDYIHKNYPFLPVFILGHSMGSFIVRSFAIKYSRNIMGLIIMGTAENDGFQIFLARIISRIRQFFRGSQKPDNWLWKKAFASLNKKFSKNNPQATGYEWLTHNKNIQLKFAHDPMCGQVFTSSAFKDMFDGIAYNSNKKNISLTRRDLPILILSGEDDPVGNFGRFPKNVYNKFNKLGYDVKLKLYPGYRHEILNENGKEKVEKDIIEFIKSNKG